MKLETIEGTVERVTYVNVENGYSVIRLAPTGTLAFWNAAGDDGLVTVTGNMPDLTPGESLSIDGQWQTNAKYGRQFKSENVRRMRPATVEGIRRFLGSGLIKGVGSRTAERIVDAFGSDTLDVLDTNPERLFEIEGIGNHRARLVIKAWAEQRKIRDVMIFLEGHGISTSLATRIYKTYGDESIGVVEADPYRLARDVWGIGFKTADRIARALGLPADHPRRLEAGVAYTLDQAQNDGHVYLPDQELAAAAAELLEVEGDQIIPAIDRAAESGLAHLENLPAADGETIRAVYLPMFHRGETGIARAVQRMLETPSSRLDKIQAYDPPALIAQAAAEANVELSDQQHTAIITTINHKISVLTGGPGTGKTTTLRSLIGALMMAGHTFALASPTGRAAKRLAEATGQPARTIHRLLGFSKRAGGFAHNEENPLPVDIVIVDECSMLDEMLAYALFRAVDPRSHLLLVGDVDQLPSVGAGDVLRDLIASGVAPVTRLAVIFRQAAQSLIISNAHRINSGEMPLFPDEAEDFFLFKVDDDAERAADLIIEIVNERVPRRFGLDSLNDIQVIVPMYRGPVGVSALNDRLQAVLNPPGRNAERHIAGKLYRVGDKVMQSRNNYEKEVFNGDVGRVHSLDFVDQTIKVLFDERLVEYDFSEIPELTHAYAISVHRSQGSEYPAVVVPMVTQHFMLLQRNLLYTAITRAKQLVVLVGSKKAIAIAVKNDKVSQRYTALAARLAGDL